MVYRRGSLVATDCWASVRDLGEKRWEGRGREGISGFMARRHEGVSGLCEEGVVYWIARWWVIATGGLSSP